MKHYYEVSEAGGVAAFDTIEEAIDHANQSGAKIISEIGGSWDDFEKCDFCGEWFPSTELNNHGDCFRCEMAIKQHGGYTT